MSDLTPPPYLYEQRSEHTNRKADKSLEWVKDHDACGLWGYRGTDADYSFTALNGESVNHWLRNEAIDLNRGHVVDAGAYYGHTLNAIAHAGGFSACTALGFHKPGGAANVPYLEGDLQQPDIYQEVEPADLIVSKMTLTHMHDPFSAFEMLANLLRPGGHMLIDTPLVYLHERNGKASEIDPTDIGNITEKTGLTTHRAENHNGFDLSVHVERTSEAPVRLNLGYSEKGRSYRACYTVKTPGIEKSAN